MNNRESKQKANKNKFSELLDQCKVSAKAKNARVKKYISPEKLAKKEAGYQQFLIKKAELKRLRRKNHMSS
jgi:hypothetical protein